MKNINLPPFYVGQKIVRIGRSNHVVKKGNTYTAGKCYFCPKCKDWKVPILEKPVKDINSFHTECGCGYKFKTIDKFMTGRAELFAPITESFQSISLSKVLEEETKLIGVN